MFPLFEESVKYHKFCVDALMSNKANRVELEKNKNDGTVRNISLLIIGT